MKFYRLIAALLVALTLGACVGFVVPLPGHSDNDSQERNDRR